MENKTLRLIVISPTGKPLETQAESLRLPASDGSMGIRYGHANAIILLKKGDIIHVTHGKESRYTLKSEAFANVKDNVVTIITK